MYCIPYWSLQFLNLKKIHRLERGMVKAKEIQVFRKTNRKQTEGLMLGLCRTNYLKLSKFQHYFLFSKVWEEYSCYAVGSIAF